MATHDKLEFELSSIAVRVTGLEDDIANLSSERLSGTIDVTPLSVGTHQVDLLMDLDDSKYSCQPIQVTVYITNEENEIPETNPPTDVTPEV